MSMLMATDVGTLTLLFDAWQVRIIPWSERFRLASRRVLRTRPGTIDSDVASSRRFSRHHVTRGDG